MGPVSMATLDVFVRIGLVAKVIHAKRELQQPMPAMLRLRTVARINSLRQQLRTGRPAITSHITHPKNLKEQHDR